MRTQAWFILTTALVVTVVPALAATITEVKLADGREAQNTIGTPVFDTSGMGAIRLGAIESAYDKKAKLVRKGRGGFGLPQYDLDPKIELGAILTEALRSEAPAMGFRLTEGDDFAWVVNGTLKEIYVESGQVPWGSAQFWGYMEVELRIQKAGQEAITQTVRAHKYYVAFSQGFTRKGEATDGLTMLLVEGAQEIMTLLNRVYFKNPPHSSMEQRVQTLSAAKAKANDLHLVGLSTIGSAIPKLMQLISATKDEEDRCHMIEALGRIGSPEVVSFLAGRYAKEDEDCRWETLRAMDAIGGDEAKALLEKGLKDKDDPCQKLASRILGKPSKK